MNAKAMTSSLPMTCQWVPLSMTRRMFASALLMAAVLLSAFGVLYAKEMHRHAFTELQQMQHQFQQMQVSRGRLLLEQGAWATQSRVQRIAEQQLAMHIPEAHGIVIVEE